MNEHLSESTYLLRRAKDSERAEEVESDGFWRTIGHLLGSAGPLMIGFMLEGSLQVSSTVMAGRLGPNQLAIVGQSNQIITVTSSLITLGSTSAQITQAAPLFTAPDADRKDIGVIAQRAFILANICALPVVGVWWYSDWVLVRLGQPAFLAEGVRGYLMISMLGIPGYALMEVSKTYLQAQSSFRAPPLLVSLVLPIHLALNYFFSFHTPLRENGAAVALVISQWLIGLGLCAYIWCNKAARECWGGWDGRALRGWGGHLRMLIPSFLMYSSESWSFEIVSLMAGRLGEVPLAAQAAVTSLDLVLCLLPVSGSLATSARLGNILGYSHAGIPAARTTVRASYALMLVVGLVIASTLYGGREGVARVFTDHEETVELMKAVFVPIAVYQVWDCLQCVGGAFLRATAKQHIVAIIHLIAYYAIGLPAGYYLAFHRSWGLEGLWAGLAFGLFLVSVTEVLIYLFGFDWGREMERGEKRRLDAELD